ncbi:hypothetical protein DNTS_023870, partial [Danionella cerebrum]
EIVVNEANFVRKCIGADSSQDDLWGKIVCTNFKVSFITHSSLLQQRFHCTHRLLGEHDIPLACVEQVVTVNDVKGKQKILGSNQKLKFNPTELILYCKDFRIIRFRFDEAGPESVKKVCLAIAHYSHPADPQLLFGFEYVGKRYHGSAERSSVLEPPSGECAPSTKAISSHPVSLADQDLKQYACCFYSQRLPLWCWNHSSGSAMVRMSNVTDTLQQRKVEQRISSAITKSHPLRSDVFKTDLDKNLPNIQDIQAALQKLRQICVIESFEESEEKWLSSLESSRWMEYVRAFLRHAVEVVYMLESRRVSHKQHKSKETNTNQRCAQGSRPIGGVHTADQSCAHGKSKVCRRLTANQRCADGSQPIRGVQTAHGQSEVCTQLTANQRCAHSSRPIRGVHAVRGQTAHGQSEVCTQLTANQRCAHSSRPIREREDRDLSCVISCLVQLMCDPHCRSLQGFQALIQKEWVMAGHRFLDRCNHLKRNDKEEVSPVFLLFLDCVWQLWNQYPAAFEFTEVYLTVLGDSMWLPDFASSKSIHLGQEQALRFPPVWDWSLQFSMKDQTLFNNPLYVGKIATCVQNGTVKTFTHRRSKKSYSSTLRGVPSALRNGSFGGNDTLSRRNSLALRLRSDLSQLRELQETPSERFIRDFFSRHIDLQGLLLPQLLPSHLSIWKLYFLRWVPEAQIPQGGPVTIFHKLSVLTDEIETLQKQLRQFQGAGATPSNPLPENSKMYFKATFSPQRTPAAPEYLSSSFPFSPIGNLCRPNVLGSPLSKFLNGAKIWLSTETLANESV